MRSSGAGLSSSAQGLPCTLARAGLSWVDKDPRSGWFTVATTSAIKGTPDAGPSDRHRRF